MKKGRKGVVAKALLILYVVLCSYLSVSWGLDEGIVENETWIEVGEDSIYDGLLPSTIARRIADVMGEGRVTSREIEWHGQAPNRLIIQRFHYISGASISIWTWGPYIFLNNIDSVISYWSKEEPMVDMTDEPDAASRMAVDIWRSLLSRFDCELREGEYTVSVTTRRPDDWAWRVDLRQLSTEGVFVNNTGLHLILQKTTGRICELNIFDWSRSPIVLPPPMDIEAQIEILHEIDPDLEIKMENLTDLGYSLRDGALNYEFEYLLYVYKMLSRPLYSKYTFIVDVKTGKYVQIGQNLYEYYISIGKIERR